FLVNAYTTGEQAIPAVAGLADGGFAIGWQSQGQDGNGWGVYMRRYDANGVGQGTDFQMADVTAGNQTMVALASRPDGGLVAVWQTPDGNGNGIASKVYGGQQETLAVAARTAGSDTLSITAASSLLLGGDGADTFAINSGDGVNVINNAGHAADGDRVLFGTGITYDHLWFEQQGADLKVSVIGGTAGVVVSSWFTDPDNEVSQFATSTGDTLDMSQVETLVQAMAAFAPPPAGQLDLTAEQQDVLAPILASAWQHTSS
ncbi:hypothetical protein, partial [Insolitispirillum peregrinum]